jgi:hypothetical protein
MFEMTYELTLPRDQDKENGRYLGFAELVWRTDSILLPQIQLEHALRQCKDAQQVPSGPIMLAYAPSEREWQQLYADLQWGGDCSAHRCPIKVPPAASKFLYLWALAIVEHVRRETGGGRMMVTRTKSCQRIADGLRRTHAADLAADQEEESQDGTDDDSDDDDSESGAGLYEVNASGQQRRNRNINLLLPDHGLPLDRLIVELDQISKGLQAQHGPFATRDQENEYSYVLRQAVFVDALNLLRAHDAHIDPRQHEHQKQLINAARLVKRWQQLLPTDETSLMYQCIFGMPWHPDIFPLWVRCERNALDQHGISELIKATAGVMHNATSYMLQPREFLGFPLGGPPADAKQWGLSALVSVREFPLMAGHSSPDWNARATWEFAKTRVLRLEGMCTRVDVSGRTATLTWQPVHGVSLPFTFDPRQDRDSDSGPPSQRWENELCTFYLAFGAGGWWPRRVRRRKLEEDAKEGCICLRLPAGEWVHRPPLSADTVRARRRNGIPLDVAVLDFGNEAPAAAAASASASAAAASAASASSAPHNDKKNKKKNHKGK